ncbi:hypothetical protein [Anaerotignum sp.]|uniref:hypothetical protein n=1 Tax=Anaerotignum sp. TaxID=2039241 RepID=UPI0028A200E5|nr:hypothetical protein [Anaerotignum sp.]
MGILSGMDIERIQSDINVNFYIKDILESGTNGAVLGSNELFKKTFSSRVVYSNYNVMSYMRQAILNPIISDESREVFRQNALKYADVWGSISGQLISAVSAVFCALGESLYSVRDKINPSLLAINYKNAIETYGMFYTHVLVVYLAGGMSKTQLLRAKQGFVGDTPDSYSPGFLATMPENYFQSATNEHMYTVSSITGSGDSISKITMFKINGTAGSAYTSVLGESWGAGSKIREISDAYYGAMLNKNLKKAMVSKKREYLTAPNTSSQMYVMDTEETKIYQPSAKELGYTLVLAATPSIPQYTESYFDDGTGNGVNPKRYVKVSNSGVAYATRDCGINGSGARIRYGANSSGSRYTPDIFMDGSGTLHVPIMFELDMQEWYM